MDIKHNMKTLACACLLAAAATVQAQNIIRPKIAGPSDLWVNSYNGVLFFGVTDMETQNSQMPMQLRFYYNSSAADTDYGYGLGFSLGQEMRYRINEIGGVVIETGDGRSDTYARYGSDYEAPAGVFSTVSEYEFNKFVLTEKTGERYYFDDPTHRRLTSIVDRYGNKTTLTYRDSLLVGVADAAGHTLTLTYTDGLLTSARASFHEGSITYEYDGLRRLKKRTDAMGFSTLYAYDRSNRISEITDPEGHKTLIAYNNAGMVSRLKTDGTDKSIRYDGDKTVFVDYTAPRNQYSYYRWDERGRAVEKVGLCCGMQSTLEYDDDDNVVKRTDALGRVSTYTYDDRGNMLSMTDALGNTERYTYDERYNQVTSFQDKNGQSYRFGYDDHGNLLSIAGPEGFSNSFTYDSNGWPLTATDANGNVTVTTYNADGTTATVMDAAGNTTRYAYDGCGNVTSATDGRGNTTRYGYDANNRLTSQTDALGHTTTVGYDKRGNITRVRDAQGRVTAYAYDADSRLASVTDAAGGKYSYTYDGRGNLTSATDPEGIIQRFEWNELGKMLSQTNGEGETTSFDYDAKGNLTAVFRPNGNTLNYFYDKLDRIEQLADTMGLVAKYTYDANGNTLSVTDGEGRTLAYTYDALNRRTAERLPSGATTAYSYDGNSNLLSVTDALGNATTYTYSSLNQQLTHTDALGATTKFEYDAAGNLSKATDARGNATSYAYDALNRNTVITFANGLSLGYTYDELGNVTASRDRAGREFRYAYSPLGDLLSKTYPDGSADTYEYDRVSRMLRAVNKDATVEFEYDRAGRLLSETLNGQTTAYAYDVAAGRRTMTYPSGMRVEERLNARDLIATIMQDGNQVVAMHYNAAGQKTRQEYANGIATDYGYDENGWLATIKAGHGVLDLQMAYDAAGNMTERKDLLDADRTETYGYDALSQLTSFARGAEATASFEFDQLGNRLRSVTDGVATTYRADNVNAYTSLTGGLQFTPRYDDNGNLLNDDAHEYAYDMNNKLAAVDGSAITYKYDALGRRIAAGNTLYYYAGDQMVESAIGGNATSFIYGNNIDEALLMEHGNDRFFYHANHLGSTLALTDAFGEVWERVSYSPYGAPSFTDTVGNAIPASSAGNNILFTGREYDAITGTYYFRARTQHPALGRFMQKDPLMYVDGMNDYSYVGNRSVIYIDRWGLNAETCDSWSGPYITAAPNPIITAAPEAPDFIRTDNKPKSDFCKEHPYICGIQGEAHGEGCFFFLAGACVDGSVAVDKDGIHVGIGTTAGLGLAASAGGGISSGYNLSGNNAGGSVDIRANAGVDDGVGFGFDYRYDGEQHKFSGTVGSVTANGSTDGSVSAGVDGGIGAGFFGGVHAGYTWSFKPWK